MSAQPTPIEEFLKLANELKEKRSHKTIVVIADLFKYCVDNSEQYYSATDAQREQIECIISKVPSSDEPWPSMHNLIAKHKEHLASKHEVAIAIIDEAVEEVAASVKKFKALVEDSNYKPSPSAVEKLTELKKTIETIAKGKPAPSSFNAPIKFNWSDQPMEHASVPILTEIMRKEGEKPRSTAATAKQPAVVQRKINKFHPTQFQCFNVPAVECVVPSTVGIAGISREAFEKLMAHASEIEEKRGETNLLFRYAARNTAHLTGTAEYKTPVDHRTLFTRIALSVISGNGLTSNMEECYPKAQNPSIMALHGFNFYEDHINQTPPYVIYFNCYLLFKILNEKDIDLLNKLIATVTAFMREDSNPSSNPCIKALVYVLWQYVTGQSTIILATKEIQYLTVANVDQKTIDDLNTTAGQLGLAGNPNHAAIVVYYAQGPLYINNIHRGEKFGEKYPIYCRKFEGDEGENQENSVALRYIKINPNHEVQDTAGGEIANDDKVYKGVPLHAYVASTQHNLIPQNYGLVCMALVGTNVLQPVQTAFKVHFADLCFQ